MKPQAIVAKTLTTRNIALIACFAPWYTIFTFWSLFPIIGAAGKFITAATIVAPVIGIVLGPYVGVASILTSGLIGLSIGPLSPPSFVAGAAAALMAGMLYKRKRATAAFAYLILLFAFAFYPTVGPVWLYLPVLWLQIIGFIILVSPLQSKAINIMRSINKNSAWLTLAYALTMFTSTLFSQIAGSLTFEMVFYPSLIPEIGAWKGIWQTTTLVYPIERAIITVAATTITIAITKTLKNTRLLA